MVLRDLTHVPAHPNTCLTSCNTTLNLTRCARTEKYLHALLLGQWVVSPFCMLKVAPLCRYEYLRLQPPSPTVAASITYGCSLHHLRSQPPSPPVTASITYGRRPSWLRASEREGAWAEEEKHEVDGDAQVHST